VFQISTLRGLPLGRAPGLGGLLALAWDDAFLASLVLLPMRLPRFNLAPHSGHLIGFLATLVKVVALCLA